MISGKKAEKRTVRRKEKMSKSGVQAGFLSGLLVSRVYGDTYGYLTAAELAGVRA